MKSLIRLMKYLKPYKGVALLAPLFVIIEVIMDLLQPYLMTLVIDNGINNGDYTYVLKIGSLMLLVALVGAIGGIFSTIYSAKASQNLGADIRHDLFVKVQSLSPKNIDKFKTGKLITTLTNDVTQVIHITHQLLRTFIRAPLLLIGAISMSLITSPELSMTLAFIIPFLIIGLILVVKYSFPYFRKIQDKLDHINTVSLENLAGVKVVKAFVSSKHENKRFEKSNNDYMDVSIKASKIVSLIMPIIVITSYLGMAAIVGLGGYYSILGAVEVSTIMAFINYLMQILMALMLVSMVLMNLSRAEASATRIDEVLVEQPDIKNSDAPIKDFVLTGNIEYSDVSFSYERNSMNKTLTNINFTIDSGETVGIIGSTGSGKSTLVSLLPRLYDIEEGEILLDGIPIKKLDLETLRRQIGFVTQKAIIFSGTVADNIKQGKDDASFEELKEAAKQAEAYEFISKFEDGFEHKSNQMGSNLSGGQKQRLSLARAFIRKPSILILDDSTSAVDAHSEEKIQKAMKQFKDDTTIFIIAQKISSLIDADKIIVLDDSGNIDGIGSHQELLKESKVYNEIYRSQYGEEGLDYAE